ncbi:diacylglycerol kinase family protein [Candidatus Roizmanbacteria bacterium]|nr:diacylglycerol kinase family protein [Candidatus Roizmanbacteria bacterium]
MIKKHTVSFINAFKGLKWALSTQPNYRIHIFLSGLAIVGGMVFKISYDQYLLIAALIFIGLTVETINTAIENTTDAIDTKWRDDIKLAKDVAAGAMLIYAIGAFAVACLIFIPKIINLF